MSIVVACFANPIRTALIAIKNIDSNGNDGATKNLGSEN